MASFGERLMFAAHTAIDAFRQGPTPPDIDAIQRLYADRWSAYDGSLFGAAVNPYQIDPAIYKGTKLLWKHVEAVVDFYAGVVYQGAIADEPEQGAIPWRLLVAGDPLDIVSDETGHATVKRNQAKRLWTAIAELQSAWNWQQQMTLRPMYAAALGDCLTELVDDLDRRFVFPQVVWPGYVKAVELDYVGNVRSYTLEYRVEERDDRGNHRETYTYRKEVDGDEFRTFKNDSPFAYDDVPAVVPNPYGFCPAVWDRHRIGAPGMVRGKSAIDGTRQALMQLNSIFSHAFDYQRKAFFQPVILSAGSGGGASRSVNLTTPNGTAKEMAESQDYVTVGPGASLLQASIDIGQTREMLEVIRENILTENPEGQFYQQLREMQQVTAPGAERLMGDVKSRVDLVRAGQDANTVKLFQMAITMCALRAHGNEWKDRNASRALTPRQMVFLPFGLESYERGEMDCTILARPIVPMTEQERVELTLLKESLQTSWGMGESGLSKTDIATILAERRANDALLAYDDVPTQPEGNAA